MVCRWVIYLHGFIGHVYTLFPMIDDIACMSIDVTVRVNIFDEFSGFVT